MFTSFTSFNVDYWYNLLSNWSTNGLPHNCAVRYIITQLEICPTSGRRYFQGYVELNDKCRIAGLKKLFVDDTANYEQRKGTLIRLANIVGNLKLATLPTSPSKSENSKHRTVSALIGITSRK